MKIVAETSRLILRQITWDDLDNLAAIYADPIVMKFHPRTLSYEEVKPKVEWILDCYEKHGFGLWATIHKADNKLIGRCGLIPQLVDGKQEVEIAYMLAKEYWRQGLATEVACASRDYGFEKLGCDRLISLIAPQNIASQKVATKVGLAYEKDTKMWGKTIHVYAISKQEIP